MNKQSVTLILLLVLLAWKLFRTDWVVSTNYLYYDSDPPPSERIEVRTYTPPVTTMWSPPRPQDIEPTATSWRHWEFFYIGGAGGPSEEPELHINWALLCFKLACGMLSGYLIIIAAFRVFTPRVRTQK